MYACASVPGTYPCPPSMDMQSPLGLSGFYSPFTLQGKKNAQDIQNTIDPIPKQVISGGTSFSAVTKRDAYLQHKNCRCLSWLQ